MSQAVGDYERRINWYTSTSHSSHPFPAHTVVMPNLAKRYIYRNLTLSCFSIKLRGKVVHHFTNPVMCVGEFSVSAAGRERVRREGKKYVHAFVTVKERFNFEPFIREEWQGWTLREVVYNPHKHDTFVFADTGEVAAGSIIVLEYPKVYVVTGGPK